MLPWCVVFERNNYNCRNHHTGQKAEKADGTPLKGNPGNSVIGSFQIFDLIYGMYQGGPGDTTRVYYYYIYENAFVYFKMGYACTLSVILFLLLVVFTLLQYFFFQKNMVTDYSS